MSYYYRGARPMAPSRGRTTRSSMGRGNTGASSGSSDARERDEFDPGNVFEVKYAQKYSGYAPIMGKPKVLGSYSIDSERDFGHDQSMLHFLDRQYYPEDGKMTVNIDLNRGWDKFIRYSGNTQDSFQNFLRWIINNQSCLVAGSQERLTADFISVRGNFTKIMRTPYNYVEAWTMYVTEFKGSVYIINWKRDEELALNEDPIMDAVGKWGHTFEHCMRGGDPEDGIDANEEYRCVLKTMMGETSLLYAPEVDCADPEEFDEEFDNLDAFILVKCCKELKEHKKKINHKRFKLNQWWVENQLSGIPRILVGFRNDDGVVHTLELLKTDELPEIAEGAWDPNVCFNFLAKFLKFVKERVHTDPGAAFIFEHESRGHIYCRKLSGSDHIDLLPSWYRDGLFAEEEESD